MELFPFKCARLASLGVAALSLLLAWSAVRLLFGVATGHVQEDSLFGVATCCDIPSSEVVSNAIVVGVGSTFFTGRLLRRHVCAVNSGRVAWAYQS